MKKWLTKRRRWLLVFLGLMGLGLWWFTGHDQRLYQTPLARVEAVHTLNTTRTQDQFENQDQEVTQRLRLRLLNGRQAGKTFEINNQYVKSMGLNQAYRVGDEVFLTQLQTAHRPYRATLGDRKRDRAVIMLFWLVTALLLLTLGRAGGFALLSVLINSVGLGLAIELDLKFQSWNAFWLFASLAVLFAFSSLRLVLGWSKKMVATLVATFLGTATAVGISYLLLQMTGERGVYYESMQYVTQVPRPLFLAETLLGSLGAVMDEATDIIATLFELTTLNPAIGVRELFLSGRNVGKSIMGPLVNVLFLIFMADTFPSALLYLKNGNSLAYTFNMNMSLGMVQSLVSGIGIVLTVPLVSCFAALLLGRRKVK